MKKYRNVEVEHIFKVGENTIQIADVFIKDKNIAFEYQRSVIPYEVIKERTKGYEKAGLRLIWLIDTNKFVKTLKTYDGISYIRYAPFVDTFLNYYQGKIFFYGWDNLNKKFEFYQIWAHNLKKRNAICIKTSFDIDEFDIPLDLKLLDKDLTSKLYPEDIENYVYEQIKYDIGINMLEQILIKTPLIYWQGMMYKFFKEGKTYPELIRIMSNIIEFKDNIYINNIQQGEIFLKVFKQYYKELVEKAN